VVTYVEGRFARRTEFLIFGSVKRINRDSNFPASRHSEGSQQRRFSAHILLPRHPFVNFGASLTLIGHFAASLKVPPLPASHFRSISIATQVMFTEGRFVFSMPIWDDKLAVQVNIFRLDGRYIAKWKCGCRAIDRSEATTIADSIQGAKNQFEIHSAAAHA
jgi:hypothetical protein